MSPRSVHLMHSAAAGPLRSALAVTRPGTFCSEARQQVEAAEAAQLHTQKMAEASMAADCATSLPSAFSLVTVDASISSRWMRLAPISTSQM